MGTKRVIFLRGMPGSGKTSYILKRFGSAAVPAHRATESDQLVVCSMDHFFEQSGTYQFDAYRLGEALSFYHSNLLWALARDIETVICDNTHSRWWEMDHSRDLAKHFGYRIETVNLFDGGCTDEELAARNIHGVPLEVIQKMRARWER